MTSEKLNQANRPFDDSQLQPGMKVYISLVIPAKDFGSLDEDSFDPVTTETVATPSLHVKGEIPKEGELVVIKDSSTQGWFLSEVLRVLPNLVEVR